MKTPSTDAALAARWLADFARAAAARDQATLAALFQPECHWRDALALTWSLETLSGARTVVPALAAALGQAGGRNFALHPARTPPRRVQRAGTEAIEAIFRFETAQGRGSGVLRLAPAAPGDEAPKAWTLFTALDELKGFEEGTGAARPSGEAYSRDFHGPNWRDLRDAEAAYADRDPAVLVVGGGQAGLSIAARLRALGVDTLIVDREARIGDNWRKRYHALTLHNQVQVNHLPYMPFPP
ncbi:MAG TPA: NAD(P)-binding protein, partial [Burkholderiales bacterium]